MRLPAPVAQSTTPVDAPVNTCTVHMLVGVERAFGTGNGAPKRQPALVHALSVVVCAVVAAPRTARGASQPTMEKTARVWSGAVIGSGTEFPPPPLYRLEHAMFVMFTIVVTEMMSPQSPGALVLAKPTKPSPLQQVPTGVVDVVTVELVVLVDEELLDDELLVEGVQEKTHPNGAPSLVTRNVRALLGFGTAPALPPQYCSATPSVKFVA